MCVACVISSLLRFYSQIIVQHFAMLLYSYISTIKYYLWNDKNNFNLHSIINILACLHCCRLLCQHISFNNTSAIIKIKLVNVVWDPNRAGKKLQLQLFFSCWLIQTKIDLTPERFYVRNKCRLLESTHGESKKEHTHRKPCVHIFPFPSSDC